MSVRCPTVKNVSGFSDYYYYYYYYYYDDYDYDYDYYYYSLQITSLLSYRKIVN